MVSELPSVTETFLTLEEMDMVAVPVTFNTVATRLHFWVGGNSVDEWSSQANLFFILAIGRSGTKFLSRLLDQIPDAAVFHEPVREDFWAYRRAFHEPQAANKYVQRFRCKDIILRALRAGRPTYGEVNSLLRRHAAALGQAFPQATVLHLVRDGRDVVRSMMARKTMTTDDRNTRGLRPLAADPWGDEWDQMDRFARLCWYWQAENDYLSTNVARTFRFEDALTNYDYFKSNVLDPCGLTLTQRDWQKAVGVPVNKTRQHQLDHWSNWDQTRLETFSRICKRDMEIYGYEF